MEIYYGLSPGLSFTLWYEEEGRHSAANVIKLIPGPPQMLSAMYTAHQLYT